jgi:multicomponent K+:H+ antiporter subunit E
MFKRLLPHPVLTPMLTIIWLLLTNSIATGQLVLGLMLGWAIPFFTIRFWPDKVTIYQPIKLLQFSLVVLFDILVANFIVARLILGNPDRLSPTFIIVPLDIKSDIAISLLANIISLTPGTVSSLLTEDRTQLVVHALDTDNADALIASIKTRYEAPLKEIFEHVG